MAVGNLLLRGASSTKTILHQVNRRMLDEKKLKNKIEKTKLKKFSTNRRMLENKQLSSLQKL